MKRIIKVQLFLLLISMGASVLAQNSKAINVVTTAVPFLRIPNDSYAGGMGGVGIATTPNANAVYWNSGKIPFTDNKAALIANYSPWLKSWVSDMYLASVAGYYHLSNEQAIYGTINYFNLGNIQFTDNSGNYLQSFHPREFAINAGYSRKLSNKVGIGIGVKYINSNLSNNSVGGNYKTASAVASDIGFYYDQKGNAQMNGWAFGAALSNLGSKISYTRNGTQKNYLPANLGIGVSYTKVYDESRLIFGLDVNKLLVPTASFGSDSTGLNTYQYKTVLSSWFTSFSDAPGGFQEELREIQISVGAEYWYNNRFALRTGYFYEDKFKGNRKYVSLGTSARYNALTFNFSYLVPSGKGVNKNPLSNNLQFGLLFRFDN